MPLGFLLLLAPLLSLPLPAFGQTYPDRPINLYVGYAAGASTDITARALARGMEKLLGVAVVVENKPGGSAAVAAGLVANKKPDGYTLGVISTGAITMRPHLYKLPYDALKDFTPLAQYSRYIGALTVRSDSPFKTIDDFIAYARTNPGMSYSSPGMYAQQHLATELFRQCKNLDFKHIPTKGGSEAAALLVGRHVDFTAGAGVHMQFVKQGMFRMLALYNTDKRDPNFPEIPTLKEIGCDDAPALGYLIVAPKDLPDPVYRKLSDAIRRVLESPEFQKTLEGFEIPYDYKDRRQLEKDLVEDYHLYKTFLDKMGAKAEKE
jgi:tripartite-type tricarboxylate transporter receptor subunit TctC